MKKYLTISHYISETIFRIIRIQNINPSCLVNLDVSSDYLFGKYYLMCDCDVSYYNEYFKGNISYNDDLYYYEQRYREYLPTNSKPTEKEVDAKLTIFDSHFLMLKHFCDSLNIKFKSNLIYDYCNREDELNDFIKKC